MSKAILGLLLFLLAVSEAQAIIRRHDVADARLLELAQRFPAVGKVSEMGDGTLIDPEWVLTAAHVADAALRLDQPYYEIGGRQVPISAGFVHPDWRSNRARDLGLLRLAAPVAEVEPLTLGEERPEVGTVLLLVGHGEQGVGNDRLRTEDGRRRAGNNRVARLTSDSIVFVFDGPANDEVTNLEVTPGAGDSGGPALMAFEGTYRVLGVSSAGSDGEDGPGSYGAEDYFVRVDQTLDWIRKVQEGGVDPTEPGQGGGISTEPSPPVSREDLRQHPAGARLVELLQAIDDPSIDLETLVSRLFAPASGPTSLERRIRGLEGLRVRFAQGRVLSVLRREPDQIDVLVEVRGERLVLGVKVEPTASRRIVAVFDGEL